MVMMQSRSAHGEVASLWIARKEGIAEHVVCPGLLFTLRTTERVDGRTDADVDEADLVEHRHPACARQATGNSAGPQDRKSTRLNSSHGSISYAVFCLKKKKTSSAK